MKNYAKNFIPEQYINQWNIRVNEIKWGKWFSLRSRDVMDESFV